MTNIKTAVLFFSRTGTSERIATKIADGLGISPIRITDDQNWNGPSGFIKGGYYASTNKSVNIKVNGEYKDIDQYVVVSPLWAGKPTPAICEFLKQVPVNKVNLVLTCNGSDIESAFTKYENTIGKLKGHFGIVKKLKNENERIEEIIQNVQ